MIHVLIAKPQAPLPTGIKLPAGQMAILVATTITEQEMAWSQSHGRPALLKKWQDGGRANQYAQPQECRAVAVADSGGARAWHYSPGDRPPSTRRLVPVM